MRCSIETDLIKCNILFDNFLFCILIPLNMKGKSSPIRRAYPAKRRQLTLMERFINIKNEKHSVGHGFFIAGTDLRLFLENHKSKSQIIDSEFNDS